MNNGIFILGGGPWEPLAPPKCYALRQTLRSGGESNNNSVPGEGNKGNTVLFSSKNTSSFCEWGEFRLPCPCSVSHQLPVPMLRANWRMGVVCYVQTWDCPPPHTHPTTTTVILNHLLHHHQHQCRWGACGFRRTVPVEFSGMTSSHAKAIIRPLKKSYIRDVLFWLVLNPAFLV